MNKTLKTIAWICLTLGLLGMAVDASVLVFGRQMAAERQSNLEEMRAAVESGEVTALGNRCIAVDANKDGKPDGDCLKFQAPDQPDQPGAGQPEIGDRPIRRSMLLKLRSDFHSRRFNGPGILSLFFMALGPVLAVVGAVILLVNCEPKAAVVKEKKEVKEIKKK